MVAGVSSTFDMEKFVQQFHTVEIKETAEYLFAIEKEIQRLLHLSEDEGVDHTLRDSLFTKLKEIRPIFNPDPEPDPDPNPNPDM